MAYAKFKNVVRQGARIDELIATGLWREAADRLLARERVLIRQRRKIGDRLIITPPKDPARRAKLEAEFQGLNNTLDLICETLRGKGQKSLLARVKQAERLRAREAKAAKRRPKPRRR